MPVVNLLFSRNFGETRMNVSMHLHTTLYEPFPRTPRQARIQFETLPSIVGFVSFVASCALSGSLNVTWTHSDLIVIPELTIIPDTYKAVTFRATVLFIENHHSFFDGSKMGEVVIERCRGSLERKSANENFRQSRVVCLTKRHRKQPTPLGRAKKLPQSKTTKCKIYQGKPPSN